MRSWAKTLSFAVAVFLLAGSARAGDREVAEHIARQLQASGQLRGYEIRVKFEDGTACLRGRVTNQKQRTAALALAFRTQGVEQVVDGLTVRPEANRQARIAPNASSQPVDYAVDRARLAVRSAPAAPIPPLRPIPRAPSPNSILTGQTDTPPSVSVEDRRVAQATQRTGKSAALPKPAIPEVQPQPPIKPLRLPGVANTLPTTVQRACYTAAAAQVHATDIHMASTLACAAAPMSLPEESTVSAGEAYASDGSDATPSLPPTELGSTAIKPLGTPSLIQTLPEPTRRTWAGNPGALGMPQLRASVAQ